MQHLISVLLSVFQIKRFEMIISTIVLGNHNVPFSLATHELLCPMFAQIINHVTHKNKLLNFLINLITFWTWHQICSIL